MPQNNYVEEHIKKYGKKLDQEIKKEKKEKRMSHTIRMMAKKLHGHRAILFSKKRRAEKIQMKKDIKQKTKTKSQTKTESAEALPTFLLDREDSARAISDKVKQQRQDKASKYSVPIAKVKGVPEIETFSMLKQVKKVLNNGKE
ncbi:Ribosome biogenesis protein [Conglomerata obtusa]